MTCVEERLRELIGTTEREFPRCFAVLRGVLAETATPETVLAGLERLAQVIADPTWLWIQLVRSPRAAEILAKVLVGSPYLTEILLREPQHLEQFTRPSVSGDLRSRQDFFEAALAMIACADTDELRWAALRRFQQRELLRIGVSDFLGLLDLRSVTNQLSLLADAIVQAGLRLVSPEPVGFAVLALGKLGGEELNYSSDIDLVFVSPAPSDDMTKLAQSLSRLVSAVSANGLLYRVDLRLRPWGNAGPVVVPQQVYLDYLEHEALLWEKQALLKARVIAGDFAVGLQFLEQCQPRIFSTPAGEVSRSVWQAKHRIEKQLSRSSRSSGEVKLGAGTIRDIEFIAQCLQLQHGSDVPAVRSINTLDALVRLADFGFVRGDEFRELSSAYVFFRVLEHALQLKHYRQLHTLPTDATELELLAHRLDFLSADQLTNYFRQHRSAVRRLFDKYVRRDAATGEERDSASLGDADRRETGLPFVEVDAVVPQRLQRWIDSVCDEAPLLTDWQSREPGCGEIVIAGFDQIGDLSFICGLLFVHGFDILEGTVFTEERRPGNSARLRFANSFVVRQRDDIRPARLSSEFLLELQNLLDEASSGRRREAQARLAKRVSQALPSVRDRHSTPSPVTIEFDNDADARATVIRISAEDTSGFLHELTNALALSGIDVRRMQIQTIGSRVQDTLRVTDESGRKLLDPRRHDELRATIVLIQHFVQLLPQSPDPEKALLHFQELLERELSEPDWLDRMASLQRPEVLAALAKFLGVSDLFWEDFLRLQHANLFPVLTDIPALRQRRQREELELDLAHGLREARDASERRERLNAFKDREMFRIDMRHLTGDAGDFAEFTRELTELAEVVLAAACDLVLSDLRNRYGDPSARWCLGALGKLGGGEIGFASDIELLLLYDGESGSETSGRKPIPNADFFEQFVEQLQTTIWAKSTGIFRIDLRLRPHGQAGTLAVSLEEFRRYFASSGPAWPFERQALIKLRPIAGSSEFGREVMAVRDELIFFDANWDAVPVRAMRERQVRQLVQAGTFNAKLSPGALVDVEYLVQLLQLTHGAKHSSLRIPNTLAALDELRRLNLIPLEGHEAMRAAYQFFRQLINALRLLRGGADDLNLWSSSSEPFTNLTKHLAIAPDQLAAQIEEHSTAVRTWTTRLGWPIVPA